MRPFFVVVCLLILYGSLFPFHFENADFLVSVRANLFGFWRAQTGISDIIGNILLFIPFGFAGFGSIEGRSARVRSLLLVLTVGFVLATLCQLIQIFIPVRSPSLIDVGWNMVGVALGIAIVLAVPLDPLVRKIVIHPASPDNHAWILAAALVILTVFVLNSLTPFDVQDDIGQFHWLPFTGFLSGLMLINTVSFLAKIGIFAAAAWLLCKIGWRWGAVVAGTLTAALVESIQLWMPSKASDVTDILLAFVTGLIVLKIPVRERLTVTQTKNPSQVISRPMWNPQRKLVLIGLAIVCGILSLGLAVIQHAPGIPYNAAELFGRQGGILDFILFSLSVIALGTGPASAGHLIAKSRYPYILAPLACGLVSIAIYAPLNIAVTDESMHDIIGSTEILKRLTDEQILGSFGARLVNAIGVSILQPTVNIIEPMIRFMALIAPLTIVQTLVYAANFRRRLMGQALDDFRFSALLSLTLLPWLILAKFIVIDLASTDNLTELMEVSAPLGIDGWAYLFSLAALISIGAVSLAQAASGEPRKRLLISLAVVVASVPVGWGLLNIGLASEVNKYNLTFSATNFLLGPDRATDLSSGTLFLRWALAQLSLTGILAFGGSLYIRWAGFMAGSNNTSEMAKKSVFATRPCKQGAPPSGRQESIIYPFLVHYTASQVQFIDSLADHMRKSPSEVVSSIVVTVHEILDKAEDERRKNFVDAILEEPRTWGDTYRKKMLTLPNKEMDFVSTLAKEANTSHSCAIRHIVAFFIEDVKES